MLFSNKKSSAIKRYAKFIEEGLSEREVIFEKGNVDPRIMGSEDFIDEVTAEQSDTNKKKYDLELIKKMVCKALNISNNELIQKTKKTEISFARHVLAYLNKYYGNVPTSILASMFNLDPSTP